VVDTVKCVDVIAEQQHPGGGHTVRNEHGDRQCRWVYLPVATEAIPLAAPADNQSAAPKRIIRTTTHRRYRTLSDESHEILIRLHTIGLTAQQIADALNTSIWSVHRSISKHAHTGQIHKLPQGGNRRQKVNDEESKHVEEAQGADNSATLADIQRSMVEHGLPKRALRTILRILQQAGFSTKQLRNECTDMQSDRVKQLRVEYVGWMANTLRPDNCVFVDETPWTQTLHRNRGRSKKGQAAIKKTRVTRGRSISLIAAMSPQYGLVGYEAHPMKVRPRGAAGSEFRVGTTAKMFRDFLKKISRQLTRDYPGKRFWFIMDNASIHDKRVLPSVLRRASKGLHQVKFLPPYSPRLNPIEQCWAQWKAEAKKTAMNNEEDVFTQISETWKKVKPEHTQNYYAHMIAKPAMICLAGKDLH
jgi:transposase